MRRAYAMKLRHLRIERFRGIQTLDWLIAGEFVCLVGPGDVGKSTVLDAIEMVLSPRWNPLFCDADFHDGITDTPIVIDATIGALPQRLLSDAYFGLRLRGLAGDGTLNDEPQQGDEEVLTLRLTVDSSLEPKWEVVTDRHPEGARISAKERERLGLVRLGAVVERDLTWSRGSVLSRLTGDVDEHAQILADAGRIARGTVDKAQLPKLSAASKTAQELSSAFGVQPRGSFEPRLDSGLSSIGQGGLALHDGAIPVRRSGLGTQRLVALAVQREIARAGGVVLVDEVEHGLEPFRIRRLLGELLRPSVPRTPGGPPPKDSGVILLTTHSPIVLGELNAENLRVVRTDRTSTRVLAPSSAVQPLFRTNPEAFLSRRVIVCEGKTELGLVRGLDEYWTRESEPFAARGVALADGGGCTNTGGVAQAFLALEYGTAVVADSDKPLDVAPAELQRLGAHVAIWDGNLALEQRVFMDLPWDGISEAIELAVVAHGDDRVRAQVASHLESGSKNPADLPADLADWEGARPANEMRRVLGATAKSGAAWFKRVDLAAELGRVVAAHLDAMQNTDLGKKVDGLRKWIFTD